MAHSTATTGSTPAQRARIELTPHTADVHAALANEARLRLEAAARSITAGEWDHALTLASQACDYLRETAF